MDNAKQPFSRREKMLSAISIMLVAALLTSFSAYKRAMGMLNAGIPEPSANIEDEFLNLFSPSAVTDGSSLDTQQSVDSSSDMPSDAQSTAVTSNVAQENTMPPQGDRHDTLTSVKPQTQKNTTKAPEKPQQPSGLININTAGISGLCTLNGIGEVKAQAIIDYRNSVGAFKSKEDLLNVKGIGEKTLEKIRDRITL